MKTFRYAVTALTSVLAFAIVTKAACDKWDIECVACSIWNTKNWLGKHVCKKGLKCLPNWPSSSGNYDGPNFNSGSFLTRRHAKDVFADGEVTSPQVDEMNHNITIPLFDALAEVFPDIRGAEQPDVDPKLTPAPSDVLTRAASQPQCCKITWECWKFMYGRSLLSVIHDWENYQKLTCCLIDFARKRPGCENPIYPFGTTMNQPPKCTTENASGL